MRLETGGISQEHEGDLFRDLLGKSIVEDERIVPRVRNLVCALRNLVGFALAHPLDRFEANARQLVNNSGELVARSRSCGGRRKVLIRVGAMRVGGREMSAERRLTGVLEDAKVDRFLVRLDAPRDSVASADADPSHKVRLAERTRLISLELLEIVSDCTHLAMDLQLLHGGHGCKGCLLWSCADVDSRRGPELRLRRGTDG